MDSEKLKYFVRLSTIQVKANGYVSPSLSLEMIGYMRELERIVHSAKEPAVQDGRAECRDFYRCNLREPGGNYCRGCDKYVPPAD